MTHFEQLVNKKYWSKLSFCEQYEIVSTRVDLTMAETTD